MGIMAQSPYFLKVPNNPKSHTSSPTLSSRSGHSPSPSPSSSTNNSRLALSELNVEEEFSTIRVISEGCFSKLLLVRPALTALHSSKSDRERLALKFVHSEFTSLEEFARELNYNYFLSPHPNVVNCYQLAFSYDNCYIYPQEYAPHGDLSRYIRRDGLGDEKLVKSVAKQLVSAVEFVHSFQLVHRDLRVENVLVFRKDLSLVKLGDFGHTRKSGENVMKNKGEFTASSVYGAACPPEICEIVLQERYTVAPSSDVWSLAILLIQCLCGESPWQSADICDPSYSGWVDWLKRKSLKLPEPLSSFTPRFLRLLKRVLEPKPAKRSKISEISKYFVDDWMTTSANSSATGVNSLLRRTSTFFLGLERVESNATSKSGKSGGRRYSTYGAGGKKRSTRSLKLDSELEVEEEPVKERVGRWIIESTINQPC